MTPEDRPDMHSPAPPPTPENNATLRMLAGMRRDMAELMEREARTIEPMNRLALRMDEGFARIREDGTRLQRDIGEIRGDLILMENRILMAITEVRLLAARFDSAEVDREPA